MIYCKKCGELIGKRPMDYCPHCGSLFVADAETATHRKEHEVKENLFAERLLQVCGVVFVVVIVLFALVLILILITLLTGNTLFQKDSALALGGLVLLIIALGGVTWSVGRVLLNLSVNFRKFRIKRRVKRKRKVKRALH